MSSSPSVNDSPSGSIEWQAESWRLTAFTSPDIEVGPEDWWAEVTGQPPDVRTSNPRLGQYRDQGAFGRGILILSGRRGRVDWVLTAEAATGEGPSVEMPTLGSATDSIQSFVTPMLQWVAQRRDVVRLAFGARLFQPVSDTREAYNRIARQVPGLRVESGNCADLIYQINRYRDSAVRHGLRVNRIAKWGAAEYSVVEVDVHPERSVSKRVVQVMVYLELDINTGAGNTEAFPQDLLSPLLNELVAMGFEIAREGDIP